MIDTAQTLAAFLHVSVACIRKKTQKTDLPRIKIGRSVRYPRDEVLAWLRAQREQQRNRRDGEEGMSDAGR